MGVQWCRGIHGLNIGPKCIPLLRRSTSARGPEYPGEDIKVAVSRDPDNLEASKTSLCLCPNSAGGSDDRNQSSFVAREELKMAQGETLRLYSSIFPTTQNCWGSLAHNTPADPAPVVPWASSADLGLWSLSSKQLVSQTPAT